MKYWKRIRVTHTSFCILYTIFLYSYNFLNFTQVAKWFYLQNRLDYTGLVAFLTIGLCMSIAIFTLFAHRWTLKPVAIIFVILGTIAAYFTNKYNVAIERSMIMNAIYTDKTEVYSLLSTKMIPYVLFLTIIPTIIILSTEITFKTSFKYLLSSLKLLIITIVISVILIYAKYDSIHRSINLSRKYLIHTIIPVNYIQSFGSIVQHSVKSDKVKDVKDIKVSGSVSSQDNLVVVLAVGETSRQKNFTLYGYDRQNTNPILSKYKDLHVLNGVARIGSTLYALPEILAKSGIPLASITSQLGINTSCYVNYTLYNLCDSVGEVKASNCGHGGTCYDEDVVKYLDNNLKSYKSGYRFVILHFGGGSHGPSYHERYPVEFQRFKPMCFDADVVNQCSIEELYNSYDNTILYVDYVVGKTIEKLDKSKLPYVFIYLSDHGESLMENGKIFHGMPPGIPLPPEQKHIPLLIKSSIPISIVKRDEYGQQDVFDTILALFSIETDVRDKDRNFINKNK